MFSVELEERFFMLANGHDCPGSKGKPSVDILCPDCQKKHEAGWAEGGCAPHRFVGNYDLHRRTWEQFGDPQPVMINGDSRKLCELLEPVLADSIVSSPPYAECPIAQQVGDCGGTFRKNGKAGGTNNRIEDAGYGCTHGQLGAMEAGSVESEIGRAADVVVSSPPYEGSLTTLHDHDHEREAVKRKGGDWKKIGPNSGTGSDGYSADANNLGNDTGDTFWSAARVIIEQSFAILRPGGCAAWVVKAFVRNKAIVDFPGDWRRLCESVGFQTVEVIHASLVKRTAEASLFGGEEVKIVERKSFFRRLAEKKNSPRIDFEVVLIMMKPGGEDGRADCVVSSPPYAESNQNYADGFKYVHNEAHQLQGISKGSKCLDAEYGSTAGQLGAMPPGRIEDALTTEE